MVNSLDSYSGTVWYRLLERVLRVVLGDDLIKQLTTYLPCDFYCRIHI